MTDKYLKYFYTNLVDRNKDIEAYQQDHPFVLVDASQEALVALFEVHIDVDYDEAAYLYLYVTDHLPRCNSLRLPNLW